MRVARWCVRALALAAAVAGAAGCGKKGPPIAPMLRIPAPVDKIAAARLGSDVYVTVAVPAANIDESVPVDIGRIEVYGYTGRVPPTRARWAELGDLVATIPVAPLPEGVLKPAPTDLPPPTGEAAPGLAVTVLDRLTPDALEQGRVFVDPRRPEPAAIGGPAIPLPTVMRRFYLAIPFSRRGRPGPPGAQAELPLTPLPDPPGGLRVSHDAAGLQLAWEPAGGLLGFLLDRGLPPEPTPFVVPPPPPGAVAPLQTATVDSAIPPGPTTYNVYRELAPDPLALPSRNVPGPWSAPLPAPVNPAPLAATSTTDAPALEREHCYVVRAQRGSVMSEPSPRVCMTPVDLAPPATPGGLAAVPSEGSISLIWEPNSEIDLAGYLVLRSEPGDATLRQLTEAPITEARYRDMTVQPGRRYIYSVVAVDSRLPLPNVSAESAPVEETAR